MASEEEHSISRTVVLSFSNAALVAALFLFRESWYTTMSDGCILHSRTNNMKFIYLAWIAGLLTMNSQYTYPGLTEAVVGEKTLSRGSDCDAVWLCPRRMKTPIAG
jgi:hypothetical protein